MSKVQFHVAQKGDKWTVKTETRAVGRYTNRVRAIAAAIDLANAAAKAGRCAEVTETEGPILQTIWSFGIVPVQPGQAEKLPQSNAINSAIDKPHPHSLRLLAPKEPIS